MWDAIGILGIVRDWDGQGSTSRMFLYTQVTDTGGKGVLTQQAHGEFIVSSETICLPNTQQVHGEYF